MLVLLITEIALDCFYLLISYSWEILNLNLKFAVSCKRNSKSLYRFSRLLGKVFFFPVGTTVFPTNPKNRTLKFQLNLERTNVLSFES